MEKYEAIEIEIIEFDEEDIIIASGPKQLGVNELPFIGVNGLIEPFKPYTIDDHDN